MATLINHQLAGAPIIFSVTATSRIGATFHRIKLSVTVTANGTVAGTFAFSKPVVTEGVAVTFDIASAVQAIIDSQQPTAATGSNIYINYGVTVTPTEEYMIDGEIYSSTMSSDITTVTGIYAGRYTDAERLGIKDLPAVWSRKPTSSPELCFTGYPHIVAGDRAPAVDGDPWQAPSVTVETVPEGINDTYNTYGIAAPADSFELRFINSMGVHENVFLSRLSTKQVNINSEKLTITRSETFDEFSRGITVKQNDYETWKLSSGPLDEAWVSYYLHEVSMAQWAWLCPDNQHYIPCHILPEETTVLVDKDKKGALEVVLTVQLDINGGF